MEKRKDKELNVNNERQSKSSPNATCNEICSCIRVAGPIGNPNDYGYYKSFDIDKEDKDYMHLLEIERPERYIPGEICFFGKSNDIKYKGYINRLIETGSSYTKKINKLNSEYKEICQCHGDKLVNEPTSGCKLIHSRKHEIDGIKCVKDPAHECLCPHLHKPKPIKSIIYKIRNEITELPNRLKLEKEQPPPFWWKEKSTDCLRPMGNPNDYSFLRPSYVENEQSKPRNYKEILQIERLERYIPGKLSNPPARTQPMEIKMNKDENLLQRNLENVKIPCQDEICSLCQCPKINKAKNCVEIPNMVCLCPKRKDAKRKDGCYAHLYKPSKKHDFILKRVPKNYIPEDVLLPPFRPKAKAFPNSQAKCLQFY